MRKKIEMMSKKKKGGVLTKQFSDAKGKLSKCKLSIDKLLNSKP
jgi:hypothetical protein